MHFLIVEDNPTSNELWGAFLKIGGYTGVVVDSAASALALLQDEKVSVKFSRILCDYDLGTGLTGLDILRYVRSAPHLESVRFGLMTGYMDSVGELRKECEELGGKFLEKPIDFSDELTRFFA